MLLSLASLTTVGVEQTVQAPTHSTLTQEAGAEQDAAVPYYPY